MGDVIKVPNTNWDELGSIIEELYGMVHSLNDFLGSERIDIAKKEAADIEEKVIKALDLYNKIDLSQI